MRIYQERTDMNLVCLMSRGMPAAKNEIAIDRMYADNNKLKVGDKLKIAGEELTVTGLVALPDYSCLFSDNSDMMFDAVKFGVGIMTEKGADAFGTTHLSTAIPGSMRLHQRMILKRKTCQRIFWRFWSNMEM